MKKYQLVIFDMDGVILDSMGPLTDLATKVIGFHLGIKRPEAKEKYLQTVGLPFYRQMELLLPHEKDQATQEKAVLEYEEEHRKMCSSLPLAKDAKMVVDALKLNHQIALVTSTHKSFLMNDLPQVRALGFDFLGGYRKGETKAYQIGAAMGVTGHSPDETILFGDSELDGFFAAQTGVAFRMITCQNLSAALNHVAVVR